MTTRYPSKAPAVQRGGMPWTELHVGSPVALLGHGDSLALHASPLGHVYRVEGGDAGAAVGQPVDGGGGVARAAVDAPVGAIATKPPPPKRARVDADADAGAGAGAGAGVSAPIGAADFAKVLRWKGTSKLQLPSGWLCAGGGPREDHELLVYGVDPSAPRGSERIAGFDFDGCLVNGSTFKGGAEASDRFQVGPVYTPYPLAILSVTIHLCCMSMLCSSLLALVAPLNDCKLMRKLMCCVCTHCGVSMLVNNRLLVHPRMLFLLFKSLLVTVRRLLSSPTSRLSASRMNLRWETSSQRR